MLDVEGIRREQAASKGRDKAFKPGKNFIRVFLFNHKVTPADVKAGVSIESNLGKTVQKPGRQVMVQFDGQGGRPILQNPGSMKKFEALDQSGDKDDQKMAGKIRPQKKFACWFVDTSVKPSKLKCDMLPISVGQAIWDKAVDSDYGEKVFGSKGRDFVVRYDDKASSPKDFYKIDLRDKELCRVLPIQLDTQVKDLLAPGGEKHFGLKAAAVSAAAAEVEATEEETPSEEEAEATEESTEEGAETTEETTEEEGTTEESAEETEEATEESVEEEQVEEKPKRGRPPGKKAVPKKGAKR
jgi:hypothetical protein